MIIVFSFMIEYEIHHRRLFPHPPLLFHFSSDLSLLPDFCLYNYSSLYHSIVHIVKFIIAYKLRIGFQIFDFQFQIFIFSF